MISYTLKNDKYEIKLPSLTFGTSDFMRHDNDEVYFELLDTYCSCGGWFIDTARVYCDWLENGHNSSEGVIGRWIKARNNRDKIVLATKGGHPAMGHMDKNRLSREDLEKDINDSLECLGTDYVDIFFLHRDDTKVPVEEIQQGIAGFVNTEQRQQIRYYKTFTIIDDTYNAGPESMEAALLVLKATSGMGEKPRRIAVLGDMLELGNHANGAHYRIGRMAACNADLLLTYGPQSVHTVSGAITGGMGQRSAMNFQTQEELVNTLKNRAKPGDVLLFKGSHGMHMEKILQAFMQED